MQGVITVAEAKAQDARAFREYGVSTLILMENAGSSIAQEAIKMLKSSRGRVAVFCGKGNNGGDGFVAARHLLAKGVDAEVFLVTGGSLLKEEAAINLKILRKLRIKIFEVTESNCKSVQNRIKRADLVIDGLLGIGVKGSVEGIIHQVIDIINGLKIPVLSIDIPSGLDADTGLALGVCVKANRTVTFVAKKQGMVLGQGLKYCGRVVVSDLGLPLQNVR